MIKSTRRIKNALRIGFTGLNQNDRPGSGLPAAQGIRLIWPKAKLIGLSWDQNEYAHHIPNILDEMQLIDGPPLKWTRFKRSLRELVKNQNLNFLVLGSDLEIEMLVQHQKELAEMGIETLLPTAKQFSKIRKDHLPLLCKDLGCEHPKGFVIKNTNDIERAVKNGVQFPAFMKGLRFNAVEVFNLASAQNSVFEFGAVGFPFLMQEKVFGRELNLAGISDQNGDLVSAMVIEKVMTNAFGKILSAKSIRSSEMMGLAKRFCEATKWRGPFELECVKTKKGLFLIEVNARLPSWVQFATALGLNLPQMMVKIATGHRVENQFDYPTEKYFYRYYSEVVTVKNAIGPLAW